MNALSDERLAEIKRRRDEQKYLARTITISQAETERDLDAMLTAYDAVIREQQAMQSKRDALADAATRIAAERDALLREKQAVETDVKEAHEVVQLRDKQIDAIQNANLQATVTALRAALLWQCKFYCDWYDGKTYKDIDGATIAYELISEARKALSTACEQEEG